jgi:hypothetical protein
MRFSDSGQARTSQGPSFLDSQAPKFRFLSPNLTFLSITDPNLEYRTIRVLVLIFCVRCVHAPSTFLLPASDFHMLP